MNPLEVRRLVLVVPWYGPDSAGGAELHARRLAESLHQAGVAIEVLTSTGRDFFSPDEQAYYPAGQQEVNGVPVLRIPSRRDDGSAWREAHAGLLGGISFPEEEQHVIRQMVAQDDLYDWVAQHRDDTLFLFMPYAWGTSFWGSMLAPDHAVLIPCLHDEPYVHYGVYRHLFHTVRAVLFNSLPEMEVAVQRFDFPRERGRVVGEGVDSLPGDPGRFRQHYGLEEPFVFYAGRRDWGKRTQMLIEYFCAYKDRHPGPLKLVLAGKNPIYYPLEFADQIVDLGYIADGDKHDACAAAAVVCQPSIVESFSLLIMESWLQQTPVLVNAECAVTVYHTRQADGGLYFKGFFEFEACLSYLLEHPIARQRLGQQGRGYVLQNYSWPAVVGRIVTALEQLGIKVPYRR